MAVTVTSRLPDELNHELNEIAKREHLDKSAIVRRMLASAIVIWKKQYALAMYQQGIFSTEQAAEFMGISLWQFSDLLKESQVHINYDIEEFEKEIQ